MNTIFRSVKLIVAICIAVTACNTTNNSTGNDESANDINADSIKKHVAALASDEFLGRKPFTEGETKTIQYLQQQFTALGLESGNGNSYFQEVPMVNIVATAAPNMQVRSPKGNFDLKAFDEYVIWTNKTEPNISLNNTDVVFAGYGVVAPEYQWNDYAGLDVKGKVVLVMVNDPGFWAGDTSLFKGNTMTYYGRWTYKFDEAARQGAKGCIIIHNTRAAGYGYNVQQSNFNTARLQLDPRGKNIPNCDVIGWMPEAAANKLFTAAGYDSTLLVKANQRGFRAVPLNMQVSTSMKVQSTYNMSRNVVAKITGSKRPDEVIIYTAHWDHFGIGRPDATGDSIYNGALDNASGTAGIIELARVFKTLKEKPERTIVFLAVTAEEQGLLGSQYYGQNPIYPVNNTVANINIDGLNRFTATKDITVVGQGQSELEDYLAEEVKKQGRSMGYETRPEAGIYYRSDHFNFAKVGIPALYTEMGTDVEGKGKEYGEQLQKEYTEKNYHQPSDEYDAATWTMQGAVQDLQLFFLVGKRLAFETAWPKWKEGSEFKALRKR
jgi:Zn-dependent M28 family amino/carboxypeptidase